MEEEVSCGNGEELINKVKLNIKKEAIDRAAVLIEIIETETSNSKQLETFFEAKHIQNIEKIANAFNCDYSLIKETEQLNKEIITFLTKKSENLSLMEIVTDSTQNPLYLQDFLTFITH